MERPHHRQRRAASAEDRADLIERALSASSDHLYIYDRDGRFLYASPAGASIAGLEPDEMIGKTWRELGLPPEIMERFDAARRMVMETGEPAVGETPLPRIDGARDYEYRIAPIRNEDGAVEATVAIVRDVTDRKQAESALQQAMEHLRAIVHSSPLAIIVLDLDNRIELWSPAAERMFGWKAEAVLGRPLPFIPEDRREAHLRLRERALRGEALTGVELVRKRRDGSKIEIGLSTAPLRDRDGRILGALAVVEEIGERKRVEREREELLRRERAAREEVERLTRSRERLVRGFSHDVRGPLAVVQSYAELLSSGLKGTVSEDRRRALDAIRQSARSALRLIDDLLELARAETGKLTIEPRRVGVRVLAHRAASDYEPAAAERGLRLETAWPRDAPVAVTDPRRVAQILSNLLSNAVKYTDEGGITVRVETHEDGGAPAPGSWIAVRISDTGPGIPANQRRLLFQEFSRLEPDRAHGAGLGLAISRRIAEALGGTITVESEVGVGSTFTLWLPLVTGGRT